MSQTIKHKGVELPIESAQDLIDILDKQNELKREYIAELEKRLGIPQTFWVEPCLVIAQPSSEEKC